MVDKVVDGVSDAEIAGFLALEKAVANGMRWISARYSPTRFGVGPGGMAASFLIAARSREEADDQFIRDAGYTVDALNFAPTFAQEVVKWREAARWIKQTHGKSGLGDDEMAAARAALFALLGDETERSDAHG